MTARRVILSTWLASLVACNQGGPIAGESGLHSDYRHDSALVPCAGNAAAVDALVAHVATTIGVPLADLRRIDYRWATEQALARDSNCGQASSCVDAPNVASVAPIDERPIARAVLAALNERPCPFLATGLSWALGGPGLPLVSDAEDRDPRPFLAMFEQDRQHAANESAALFVAYLLQAHGAERMRTLYRTIPPAPTLADWEAAFTYIYGGSVDAIVEEYLATTSCPEGTPPLPSDACSSPELAATDGSVTFERVLACDDEDVVGGVDDELPPGYEVGWGYRSERSFTIETTAEYDITVDIPRDASGFAGFATIRACGGCSWLPDPIPLAGTRSERVTLAAGRYSLEIHAVVADSPVHVTIARAQ